MTCCQEPIRVLHLQTDTGVVGGIATYISELVRSPAMRSHSFIVAVANLKVSAQPARALYGEGAILVEMPERYSVCSLPAYVNRLRTLIETHRIDIVHAHAMRSALAVAILSRLHGTRFVYTNHGLRYTQKVSTFEKVIFLTLERFICGSAAVVCAVRRFDHQLLTSFQTVDARKLRLIESRILAPIPAAIQGGALPNEYVQLKNGPPWRVVGIGSLVEVKRPDRFLNWVQALSKGPLKVSAVWIGDGPLRGAMERRVQSVGLPVTFLGHQPREVVFRVLAATHLLFLTSQFEVFPFGVLEAYSQGVPVISGHFAGAEDFIDSGRTGFFVDADDAQEVARRVSAILRDVDQLSKMSRSARKEFEQRFSDPELMAQAYSRIYFETATSN